jgi:hypothetical protein
MRPHLEPEILALLAGGDLTGTDARTAAEHVAGCEACGRELAENRKSVAEFRGWAAGGEPAAEEIQALHEAVMVRLPRTQRGWFPGWAAAAAAVVICVSAVLWSPWRVGQPHPSAVAGPRDSRRPLEASVVDGVKSHGDTSSQGSVNRGQRSAPPPVGLMEQGVTARRAATVRERWDPAAAAESHRVGKITAAVKTSNRSVLPRSRSVSLEHDADGEPMLQIATANPNVLILWYVDEGSKKDDDDE